MKKSLTELVTELTAEDRAELLITLNSELDSAELNQLETDLTMAKTLPERVAIKQKMFDIQHKLTQAEYNTALKAAEQERSSENVQRVFALKEQMIWEGKE